MDALTAAIDAAWDEYSEAQPCDICGEPATMGKYDDRFCGKDANNCAGFIDSCNTGSDSNWWDSDPGALASGYTPTGK